MDERRFRLALDTIEETIKGFGEETIFAALGVIADRFGWELSVRDPGPECEMCDWADRAGVMTPIHLCPTDAPTPNEVARAAVQSALDAGSDAGLHRSIDLTGRWN